MPLPYIAIAFFGVAALILLWLGRLSHRETPVREESIAVGMTEAEVLFDAPYEQRLDPRPKRPEPAVTPAAADASSTASAATSAAKPPVRPNPGAGKPIGKLPSNDKTPPPSAPTTTPPTKGVAGGLQLKTD